MIWVLILPLLAALAYLIYKSKNEGAPKFKLSESQHALLEKLKTYDFANESFKIVVTKEGSSLGLSDADTQMVAKALIHNNYEHAMSDGTFSKAEIDTVSKMMKDWGDTSPATYKIDSAGYNKALTLGLLAEGILPKVGDAKELGIIFKRNETLHWASGSGVVKIKAVTTGYRYRGMSYRIRIAKGLNYTIGNIKGAPMKELKTFLEDTGILWISNMRVGFKGQNKNWSFPIAKIASIEMKQGFLDLFKDGKESPYKIAMDDFSVTLAVLSFLVEKTNAPDIEDDEKDVA